MSQVKVSLDVAKGYSRVCRNVIGREPIVESCDGVVYTIQFDPPLTPSEITRIENAMPAWIRWLLNIEVS